MDNEISLKTLLSTAVYTTPLSASKRVQHRPCLVYLIFKSVSLGVVQRISNIEIDFKPYLHGIFNSYKLESMYCLLPYLNKSLQNSKII